MWTSPPEPQAPPEEATAPAPSLGIAPGLFAQYFWVALKNVIGWVLILASAVLGPVPGPGGLVFFLVGFGMVSFPGKRRLIVRLFRGRPYALGGWGAHLLAFGVAAVVPLPLLGFFAWRDKGRFAVDYDALATPMRWLVYAALVAGCWVLAQLGLRAVNLVVRVLPKARRASRPWLRHRGVDFLPPRLRRRVHLPDGTFAWRKSHEGDILTVHPRHRTRLSNAWTTLKPWLKRATGLAITVAIFAWMLKPVVQRWDDVAPRVRQINWGYFALASVMFAAFLFVFRAVAWRKILAGFGYKLPLAPATRIWSTSELARYLPGVIWQVVGRVYLVKPYGVSGTVCSTSQILELVVFLLANVLVALGCLAFFVYRLEAHARAYLYLAAGLAPLLMTLLHPKVFYTALTKYMTWRGKPLPARRVRGKTLTLLTVWSVAGLLWQSAAIWLLCHGPLELPIQKWWAVAGCYCLAWCAGFIAIWAPGGLGVREFIFVMTMAYVLPNALPAHLRANLGDDAVLRGFLAFLGILLRLWTIAGELILASLSYAADYRGALGRADAPGRVAAPVVEG